MHGVGQLACIKDLHGFYGETGGWFPAVWRGEGLYHFGTQLPKLPQNHGSRQTSKFLIQADKVGSRKRARDRTSYLGILV